ncbi:MAG: hypothetical protein GIW99_00550 [Candidatus Eremiobacteraeota bacterium]|nr:hypothetical protein [Candidatus Eremiobacteraeota bacterium]MBC5826175.1 hypothetical protein [Candidatus Eremiobacteraeota bacterium]
MMNEFGSLLQRVTGGNADPQALEQAATDHVSSMDTDELSGHLQTAAQNAQQNGQGGLAQQITSIVSEKGADPQGLKDAAISFIKSNPQVLTHFAPPFAQGLLNRVNL